MQKKSYIFSGLFFLSLSVLLVIYEAMTKKPKSGYGITENSPHYPFEELASFIHNFMGYKLVFPVIGIICIALISYIIAPYLTKEEERP